MTEGLQFIAPSRDGIGPSATPAVAGDDRVPVAVTRVGGSAHQRCALVLIHGAGHSGRCWDLVVDAIHRDDPDLPVLAVDLPGRDTRRRARVTASIDTYAQAVIVAIDAAGFDRFVLVGHSMAGLVVPRVAAQLGPRVHEMILISAPTPPHGQSIIDTLSWPSRLILRALTRSDRALTMPRIITYALCNGAPAHVRRQARLQLCSEAPSMLREIVDYSGLPEGIACTWVLTGRDRLIRPRRQQRYIAALGIAGSTVRIEGCHDVMLSHPDPLATILAERCRSLPPEPSLTRHSQMTEIAQNAAQAAAATVLDCALPLDKT